MFLASSAASEARNCKPNPNSLEKFLDAAHLLPPNSSACDQPAGFHEGKWQQKTAKVSAASAAKVVRQRESESILTDAIIKQVLYF